MSGGERAIHARSAPIGEPAPRTGALAFPRMRPTLMRIPAASRVTSWLERPYDRNGSGNAVVGMWPVLAAMCINAVTATAGLRSIGRVWPYGNGAVCAIRNESLHDVIYWGMYSS